MGKRPAADGPNVLLFFCDQLRRDALGAYGNEHVHTPNLDRLADGGRTYERAYTPVPVCIPARHSLLTGHRPKVHGYWSNNEWPMDARVPTLPRILRDAGWITQAVGKMHFMPPRSHHGFERMQLMEETPTTREEDDYLLYLKSVGLGNVQHQHGVRHLLYQQPQRSLLPEEHTGNHWVADRTIEFLRANAGRPFFCWSSWIAPHPPYNTVDKWADFYDADRTAKMPMPLSHPDEVLSEHVRRMRELNDVDGGTDERRIRRLKRIKACYTAQVSHVDEQVGRILGALDELGLSDNTLVIFTADHGEMLGDHTACQKSCSYEGAWGIPMILRWPKVIGAGERSRAFATLLDVLPTCLDACALRAPAFEVPLPGSSLIDGREVDRREYVFAEENARESRFLAVRDDRWKLTYWFRDGFTELWDLENDPNEFHNLALGDMDLETERAFGRLREQLYRFEQRWGPAAVGHDLPNFGMGPVPWKTRNGQFPSWPPSLIDPAEVAALNDFDDEILRAVEKEPDVRLADLDLDWWVEHGGSKTLVDRVRKGKTA
ncbi:MAG TPA: sulfatase-like hydrolase/transferase [Planctomycetota bacterium]|nr:sulfatase-like hydrolase/transferase [Planctomycetota bacterium]